MQELVKQITQLQKVRAKQESVESHLDQLNKGFFPKALPQFKCPTLSKPMLAPFSDVDYEVKVVIPGSTSVIDAKRLAYERYVTFCVECDKVAVLNQLRTLQTSTRLSSFIQVCVDSCAPVVSAASSLGIELEPDSSFVDIVLVKDKAASIWHQTVEKCAVEKARLDKERQAKQTQRDKVVEKLASQTPKEWLAEAIRVEARRPRPKTQAKRSEVEVDYAALALDKPDKDHLDQYVSKNELSPGGALGQNGGKSRNNKAAASSTAPFGKGKGKGKTKSKGKGKDSSSVPPDSSKGTKGKGNGSSTKGKGKGKGKKKGKSQ